MEEAERFQDQYISILEEAGTMEIRDYYLKSNHVANGAFLDEVL